MSIFGDHEPKTAPENLLSDIEDPEKQEDPNPPVSAKLIRLAEQRYQFGVTPAGEHFVYRKEQPHMVRMFKGGTRGLRAEFARSYLRAEGRPPANTALAECIQALEGIAEESAPEELHLRVSEKDGSIYIDQGDTDGTVFRITRGSWNVQTSAPVKFRRTRLTGMLPSPVPHPRGAAGVMDLFSHLNISEQDYRPVLAWLVAALIAPEVPHPVLAFLALHGTAKSTATRRLGQMVDPSPVPTRTAPRNEEQWVTAAAGSWVVGIDNASSIQPWFSDALCRAVTGDGDVRRQLFSDGDLTVIQFRRCVILNGIDLGGLRGDLADRLLAVDLRHIPEEERREESELNAQWEEQYPSLFAALLAFSAEVYDVLPAVELAQKPRMADFARVLAAVDKVADDLGLPGDSGLDRFMQRGEGLAEESLSSDVFIMAVLALAEQGRLQNLTSAEILKEVESHMFFTSHDWRRPSRGWPTSPKSVTGYLKRNIPQMRKTGWAVYDDGKRNKENVLKWTIEREERGQN